MEIHQHQKIKEGAAGDSKLEDGCSLSILRERQSEKKQLPSASSSPSHEFSFSVSLHTSSAKAKVPPSFTIDLSPADDIFFHGHLLPLHLLSHLPVPPRCSTNSMDGYTVPASNKEPMKEINELFQNREARERCKSRSFSFLGIRLTRRRIEVGEQETLVKLKRKLGFNLSHVLRRYARMVRPLLQFRGRREDVQMRRQRCSFSGNLSMRNNKKQELRGRGFSAPVSTRSSPTNSGVLLATAALPSANDSTMEELQAAIQAAIAHCKNSILKDEKLKC